MIDKINISAIIIGHIRTLKDEATGKLLFSDILLAFFAPLLPASFAVYFIVSMSDAAVGAWVSAFSIFAGLLLIY